MTAQGTGRGPELEPGARAEEASMRVLDPNPLKETRARGQVLRSQRRRAGEAAMRELDAKILEGTCARGQVLRSLGGVAMRGFARLLMRRACALGLVVVCAVLAGCTPRDFARRELLWPDGAPGARGDALGDRPELFYYLPAPGTATGAAAIVAPGGSYAHTGGLRPEAFPTARWLAEQGIVAVVLRYRVSGDGYAHRDFLKDGSQAVQRVRAQADALGVDANKIGFIGFSAGGHLAGFVATACPKDGAPVSCRPDFIVMVYPVVTLDDRWAHQRSKRSMLGEAPGTPGLV